jgi:2,5-furandicarboxylate decarboxylase 1
MSQGSASFETWLGNHGSRIGALEIAQPVDPMRFEATSYLEHLEREQPAPPPVLFSAPRALSGDRSEFRLLFNAYASLPALNSMLGMDSPTWPRFLTEFIGTGSRKAAPRRITTDIPVHRHVRQGEDVDLKVLPWVRHVTMDGGPYFTPIVVAHDAERARYNLSWNRAMYLDERHISVHISPRHLWALQRSAEEKGEDLRVALVLGHHPAFNLGAAALTSHEDDEYEAAAGLLGGDLRLAPSVSYGSDLLVPADAEVVIEGRLLAGQRAVEGPFGEYLLYVGPQKLSQVLEVDAITWRQDPVIVEIFTSHIDHLNAHIAIEASIFQKVRAAIPQVVGISWFRGGGPTTLILAIAKSSEGQPMRAALAALAASNVIKQVIVVDDDVDIEDSHDVLWAMSTRLRADEDLTLLHNLQGNLLDPSQSGTGKTSGFVMDATKPLGVPFPPKARVPASVLAEFPLSAFQSRRL